MKREGKGILDRGNGMWEARVMDEPSGEQSVEKKARSGYRGSGGLG